VAPSRVTVTADLTDQRNERSVPVSTADFTGTPAPGYQLDSIAASPSQVTLVGDPQQLRNIPNVATEPISIDGLNQTTTVPARLQTGKLPVGVTIKDNIIQVQVTVNIVEITSTAKFQVPIQTINLRPGLQATLSQREATITLRGTRAQLDQVGTSIAALVNLGSVTGPGGPTTVNVDVQVPANSGVKIAQVDPPSIQITASAPATPTPVPTATPTPRPTTPPPTSTAAP
jgi:YbbR domain-containing protein